MVGNSCCGHGVIVVHRVELSTRMLMTPVQQFQAKGGCNFCFACM